MVICRITGHAGPLTKVRNFARELAAEEPPFGCDVAAQRFGRAVGSIASGFLRSAIRSPSDQLRLPSPTTLAKRPADGQFGEA